MTEGRVDEEGSTDEQITFSLTISLDRENFFRRACPSCGLEFKTEGNPADFSWALESQLRRVSEEVNIDAPSVDGEPSHETLRCPYCEHVSEAREMQTSETALYLRRFAMREYALPKLHRMLSEFANSLGNIGSKGGMFSISITSNYEIPPLPQRPIYGPDSADMVILHFLCCEKKLKVLEGWTAVSRCSYCEIPVFPT
jgi:hypothetical protein